MKPLFKRLPAISHTQIFQPLKRTLLTLLFTVPQVPIQYPLLGSISSGGKALAQAQTSCPAGISPATLEWTRTDNLQEFLSQNLSAGGVSTTFRFDESSPGEVIDQGETLIETVEYGGINEPNLRFNIGGNSLGRSPDNRDSSPAPAGSSARLTITFAQPVTLASPLTLLDIDRDGQRDLGRIYQDRVTVTAFNGNTPVGVTGTAVSPNNTRVTNQGNSVLAVGINENARTDQSAGNIQVRTSERITQIQILYEPGTEFGAPGQDETIGLARISICPPPATLGDTVYNDTNGNSTQDTGEAGISRVTVNLAGAGPDGQFGTPDDITRTTTTDNNGRYSFPDLPAGNYRVTANPLGFTPTQTQPNAIALATGQNVDTVDFGFRRPPGGTIGDFVFNDRNGDRAFNSDETGIANATVILRNASGVELNRTTTNDTGNYIFTGLPLDNYTVEVITPGGGLNPTTNTTLPANLTEASPEELGIDFGFRGGAVGAGNTGLRLVKRITNVFRNGQLVNIADISGFVDDPNDNNDNILQQAGRPPFGVYQIGQTASLQSGDEVEYTIYYLAEGDQEFRNVSFCDLIPAETSYSSGEISVNRADTNTLLTNAQDSDQGAFYTPLQPLPEPNQCPRNQTNTKGAVIVNLDTITPDRNFGNIRFRARID